MMTARQQKIFQIRLKRESEKRESETSFSKFGQYAWPIIEPGRPYEHGWHIDAIADHLMAVAKRDIPNLIINEPPRHMKSIQVCVMFPAWVWGPFNMPFADWLFSSYNPKLTSRDSVKCRKVIDSIWYKDLWKDNFLVDPERKRRYLRFNSLLMEDQNEKMNYRNIHSGTRIATSQGGTGTGEGGDFIIYDDPHKVGWSEGRIQSSCDYWEDEMSTRGNDPNTVRRIVVMQRISEKDLTAKLKEKYGNKYEHLVLPFEYDPKIYSYFGGKSTIGFKDPRKNPGERLWSRFDGKAGDDLKALIKPYQQSGQLQQNPSPKEGTVFQRKWFKKRWTELPPRFDHLICTWDLTFGTGEEKQDGSKNTGAFDVGYVLGWFRGKYYVIDEVRKRMEPWEQESETAALKQKWTEMGARTVLIEDAANGRSTAKRIKANTTGVILIKPEGSKDQRAEAQSGVFRSEDVLFPDSEVRDWADDAVEEFISFGSKAKYKDRVDALCQGIDYLEPKVNRMKALSNVDFGNFEKGSEWTDVNV